MQRKLARKYHQEIALSSSQLRVAAVFLFVSPCLSPSVVQWTPYAKQMHCCARKH